MHFEFLSLLNLPFEFFAHLLLLNAGSREILVKFVFVLLIFANSPGESIHLRLEGCGLRFKLLQFSVGFP
ncbi:MAG: hypothetical protein CMJ52_08110 [Planctomycetaceae bacterium]|nr:hypothetical protein [Planctomycetaceae bacterium]